MAEKMKKRRPFRETVPGQILLAVVYALMLCAVLVCFTGHGAFIYEGF